MTSMTKSRMHQRWSKLDREST